jgi:biopolymer transport protein ExbD
VLRPHHALALSLTLTACASKTPALRAACAAGSADACEIVAARLLVGTDGPPDEAEAATFGKRAFDMRMKACAGGDTAACGKLEVRGMLMTSMGAMGAVPLDVPKPPPPPGAGAVQQMFTVELRTDGTTHVNGKLVADDAALLATARGAIAATPDLRAVIRADAAVTHGRVIHVLDLLKQAGISKIAFGVSPAPAAP